MNKEYKNLKGIAFDYWGLFSPMDFPIHWALEEHGLTRERRREKAEYLEAVSDHNLGKMSEKEYIAKCANIFGVDLDYHKSRIKFEKDRLNHSLIQIVKKLRTKYKIGLLSNNSDAYTREYLFKPKLDKLFDVMVLSHLEGMRKPEPEIYLLLAKRMGLKPSEILYLDDQPSRLSPAGELGFKILLYEGPKTDEILEKIAM